MDDHTDSARIAVVIPSYKVTEHILGVLARIGDEVDRIYVVDDRCPDESGKLVETAVDDPRVVVTYRETNGGVGAATLSGYRQAIADGADVIVKLDGDGQMDPALIPAFVAPIARRQADYTKGNRFYRVSDVRAMPFARKFGNALLSFLSKLSSGYWKLFDPTNGYTAIAAPVAEILPYQRIRKRFFFESDMLFHLGILDAVVADIPMTAIYGEETSNLSILRSIPEFFFRHSQNFVKRVFYDYVVRDFSIASLELFTGLVFVTFGFAFGLLRWFQSVTAEIPATAGTVMVAALPLLIGTQLLLSFLSYDMQRRSAIPLQVRLLRSGGADGSDFE